MPMDLSDPAYNRQQVSAVITSWDPMGVLHSKPKAYDPIITELVASLGPAVTADILARNIGTVCRKWFGAAAFEKDFDECRPVAKKIIKLLTVTEAEGKKKP